MGHVTNNGGNTVNTSEKREKGKNTESNEKKKFHHLVVRNWKGAKVGTGKMGKQGKGR